MEKKYFIYANDNELSNNVKKRVEERMSLEACQYTDDINEAGLIFCIGGDGALLRLMRRYGFPEAAIVGINTGHLGFFQEFSIYEIDKCISLLKEASYHIQEYIGISADVYTDSGMKNYTAINEIVVRSGGERLAHLDITVAGQGIARFSGDGLLICTPAGSTAYNYSLGGAIVDPDIDILQITPIAPVNNVAYRSFTSGIIVPTQTSIQICPVNSESKSVAVIEDGGIVAEGNIKRIDIHVADRRAKIVRFNDYNFWNKVKDKIIG